MIGWSGVEAQRRIGVEDTDVGFGVNEPDEDGTRWIVNGSDEHGILHHAEEVCLDDDEVSSFMEWTRRRAARC